MLSRRKPLKRNVFLFVLLLVLMPALAWAAVVADSHFNALNEGGFNCYGSNGASVSIASGTGTPDAPNALKIIFPSGFVAGNYPMECSAPSYNSNEIYRQVYVMFPVGYQHYSDGGTGGADKIAYDYLDSHNGSDNPGNFATIVWNWGRNPNGKPDWGWQPYGIMIYLQPNSSGLPQRNLYPNQPGAIGMVDGVWYKLSWYVKLNTSGSANGIARAWINDVLQFEYTDVELRKNGGGAESNWGTRNFWLSNLLPIWGGHGETKDQSDFFYMDHAIVSTTPIGGGSDSISIGKEPNPPNKLIIK